MQTHTLVQKAIQRDRQASRERYIPIDTTTHPNPHTERHRDIDRKTSRPRDEKNTDRQNTCIHRETESQPDTHMHTRKHADTKEYRETNAEK